MAETKLIVIRHGETEWNLEGRWQGHKNSPLTANGINQAKAVAKHLANYDISVIYASDLGRAFQTAQHISEATKAKIFTDTRLRERNAGVFQGLTKDDLKEQFPDEFKIYREAGPEYVIPGGESATQRYEKVVQCIHEIAETHPGRSVVIVTHGGVLNGIFRYVIGLPLDAPSTFKLWNTGINSFSCENGRWKLLSFGETYHLNSIKTMDDG